MNTINAKIKQNPSIREIFQQQEHNFLSNAAPPAPAVNGPFWKPRASEEMAKQLGKTEQMEQIRQFLEGWLRFHYCQIQSDGEHKEICQTLNRHLDVLELQDTYVPRDDTNYIMAFLTRVNRSFLTLEAFGRPHSFASIPEIAAREPMEQYKTHLKGPVLASLTIWMMPPFIKN